MRILVSNPDTLGDLILRQPLLAALAGEGHELGVVVRAAWRPLVPMVAPGARVLVAPGNVYDPGLAASSPDLHGIAAEAAAWKPDMLVVAPFQWTVLEERLSLECGGAVTVRMSGRLFGDSGPVSAVRSPVVAAVTEEMPEVRKNRALAAAVLGRAVELPDPRIEARPEQLEAARGELAKLGLEAGSYWVACVGDTADTRVRNWRPRQWGELLSAWSRERGRKFLLIGHEPESVSARAAVEAMGDERGAAVPWFGTGDGALDTLVGLAALSAGYVGRDTGPMHLAAALRRPVLAVFGGGTWPRFLPACDRSVAVTVGVPCIGCGWRCHLEDSYCIKNVPVAEVLRAAGELEDGAVPGREARVLRADEVLLARVGREGAHAAQVRLAQVSAARSTVVKEGSVLRAEPALTEAAPEGAALSEPKPWASHDERTLRLQEELRRAQRDLGLARARVTELEVAGAEAGRHRAEQAGALLSARQLYAEAKARAETLEAKLLEKTAEAAASREHARIKSAGESISRKQYEESVAQRIKAEELLAHKAKRLAEAEARIKDLDARARTAEGLGSPESRQREAKLREQIADLSARLSEAEGQLNDVRLRERRLSGDRATLQRLAQEHEAQVVVLRGRVRDLMASRWRKLGQRLHLAMTMPWEENGNGKPR
ncbi:MAG: hypothetical protein IT437_05430 [Phycisphaerales bacterium]|nr:hypothetical protein [Phycisphaerales bacterium]